MNKQTQIVATASPPSLRQTGGAGAASASPHPVATRMFGNALIADASKVSPAEFMAAATEHMFPTSKIAERYAATWRYCAALGKCDDRAAVKAAYERELAEIDARYADDVEPIVDTTTAPLLPPVAKHFGRWGVGA